MNQNKIFINLSFIILFFSTVLTANQKVSIQLSWLHQFQFAGFYMAKEKGFYKDDGLDVEIKEFTFDLNRATYIGAKKADFGIGRSSLLIEKANGEDVIALGAIYQKSPLMLLVTKDSGIHHLSDLKNKRVMITDDAKDTVAIMAMLNANGININDIKIQQHSFNFHDLIDNKTDAMASYISNEPISLENNNIEYKIFHPKDYGFDFYGDILYSSSLYIKNNPKLTKDFFDSSMEGWKYAFENINETVEVIYHKYNTQNKSKSDLLKEANVLKKLIYDNDDKIIGSLDKVKLQKIVDVYKVLGLINQDIDLDNFVYKYNPHKTYAFELSKSEIVYLMIISIFIIAVLIILFIFSSIKLKLLQEVKNAKQELDTSYLKLHKLTENIPGAIYQYRLYPDGKATFPYISNAIKDLYEVTPTDLLNDATPAFNRIHQDDLEMLTTTILDSAKTMNDWNIEYRVNLPKKGLRWLHGKSKPEKLEDGSILWHGIFNDITEQKKKDKLLYEQTRLASMGEMIGNIAHQWRQPLSIISTAATGMVLEKEYNLLSDVKFKKNCKAINDNAQYLSNTIEDFKNFIKGNRSKTIFNLSNNINSFLNLIEGTIKSNNISLILELDDDIVINGYENELIQCFINIFNNSKDALNEKKLDNKFVFITTTKIEKNLVITIKDNATGIPSEILTQIFEPYFTTKDKSQGTGLGLSMTYNLIVDGMNGTIEADNINYEYEGQTFTGAEFTITLSLS